LFFSGIPLWTGLIIDGGWRMKELDAITKFAHPDGTALFGRFLRMRDEGN
jgi:hypothetical protein